MNIKALNKKAIKEAIKKIRATYSPDKIVMQAVQALNESEQMINTEYERLREFYWRYYPEALNDIKDINQLIKMINKGVKPKENTMGYDLSDNELLLIKDYASIISKHLKSLKVLEQFIKKQTKKFAPETSNIASPLLTARLITLAGGFKEMALMPASTIQLLGAEKALFRHLRTGKRPPKHGIILFHQDVQASREKGKTARQLANKIMISIRKDYFGGKK